MIKAVKCLIGRTTLWGEVSVGAVEHEVISMMVSLLLCVSPTIYVSFYYRYAFLGTQPLL